MIHSFSHFPFCFCKKRLFFTFIFFESGSPGGSKTSFFWKYNQFRIQRYKTWLYSCKIQASIFFFTKIYRCLKIRSPFLEPCLMFLIVGGGGEVIADFWAIYWKFKSLSVIGKIFFFYISLKWSILYLLPNN